VKWNEILFYVHSQSVDMQTQIQRKSINQNLTANSINQNLKQEEKKTKKINLRLKEMCG
jgi:hypothetical protein